MTNKYSWSKIKKGKDGISSREEGGVRRALIGNGVVPVAGNGAPDGE